MSENFTADILVIAGTVDGRQIIKELANLNLKVAATVTTRFGHELIEDHANVRKFEKRLTSEGMAKLIKSSNAKCLIDASHPFASEASLNAMKACEKAKIKYLRYEREETKFEDKNVIRVKTYEDAAKIAANFDGNIFLTIGSKNLKPFYENIPKFQSRLIVRVLPESHILAQCEEDGLSAKNIIAMKGPFSENLNYEMLSHCEAKVMVTKESGDVGGTEDKIKSALKLGIKIILIERPVINYKEKVKSISEILYSVGNVMSQAKK